MHVETTTPETTLPQNALLAFQDVTVDQAEIIIEALIHYKSKLDAEEFKAARSSCVDMFQRIDSELIKSR